MWSMIVIQWLSVLCGLVWIGGVLYVNVVLLPAIITSPLNRLRSIGGRVGFMTNRVLMPTAALMIVLGVVRGTLFGRVQGWSALYGTASGVTCLLAFLATGGIVAWGIVVSGRAVKHLRISPLEHASFAGRKVSASLVPQLQRVKLLSMLELLGFVAIFASFISLVLIGVGL